MYQSTINALKPKIQLALEKFQEELQTLRVGRANPSLIEGITVSYYGTNTPIKQVASIAVPDASSILITPWDKNALSDVELAVRNSDLGLSPINDGKSVRLVFPPLTDDRRQEMAKLVSRMAEEVKITIRQFRQDIWNEIKDLEKEKKITEDDRYSAEEELNKLIEESNKKIQEFAEKKEADLKRI